MRRLLLLPLLLAACSSPGYRGLWQPKPAEALVTAGDGAPIARLSVAVLGTWKGDPWDGELHVRYRLENSGSHPLRLPLARCEVFSGDLQSFGKPHLVGGEDREVAPGEAMVLDAGFVPPAADADLRGLQVRWVVLAGGAELPGSLTFNYVEPWYPNSYGSIGVGVSYGYYPYDHCWDHGWGSGVVVGAPVEVMSPHVGSAPGHP